MAKLGMNEHLEELLASSDPGDFLKKAFAIWKRSGKPVSFGEFSKRAGLSSRSFPREVVIGNKRISRRSLAGFVRALGISGDLRLFFSLLVSRSEALMEGNSLESICLAERLARIRKRLLGPTLPSGQTLEQVFRSDLSSKVYAASGDFEVGSTPEEIAERVQGSLRDVLGEIEELAKNGLLLWDAEKRLVRPVSEHLSLFGQAEGSRVQEDYLRGLQRVQKRASRQFADSETAYMQFVFSVRRSHMPQLKEELSKVLCRFAEDAESASGDRVARLVLGMVLEE